LTKIITRQRALIELIFAGALWGFGFVATIWGLKGMTSENVLFWRFLIAFLAAELIWWVFLRQNSEEKSWHGGTDLPKGIIAGIILASLLLPQTWGLETTSAGKSGFITTLYVLLVPLLSHLFLRQPNKKILYLYVLMGLVGTAFLVELNIHEPPVRGDLWTLLCAFGAALHILYVGLVANTVKDPFRFNTMQSFFCFICVSLLMLAKQQPVTMATTLIPWTGVFALAFGSSILGFTIQVRSQKILSPTVASMIFLLESPFAMLFGVLLLQERFHRAQLFGAFLILVSAFLALKSDSASDLNKKPAQ
jgi:drug/metabolite transporter (DMT)-like permease